jgi:hypothetical protein
VVVSGRIGHGGTGIAPCRKLVSAHRHAAPLAFWTKCRGALGNTPLPYGFPGFRQFHPFLDETRAGLRPGCPAHAPTKPYPRGAAPISRQTASLSGGGRERR